MEYGTTHTELSVELRLPYIDKEAALEYIQIILSDILCEGGGIGRRASLRSWWELSCAGSSPALRTLSFLQ